MKGRCAIEVQLNASKHTHTFAISIRAMYVDDRTMCVSTDVDRLQSRRLFAKQWTKCVGLIFITEMAARAIRAGLHSEYVHVALSGCRFAMMWYYSHQRCPKHFDGIPLSVFV